MTTKPTKPTSVVPSSFGGTKTSYTAEELSTGYKEATPEIFAGDNLNYLVDSMGENITYNRKIADFVNDMPINKVPTVNSSNQLVYSDFVDLSSNQTIGGEKTLTASPIVPTQENDDNSQKAVNSEWVNNRISTGIANTDLSNLTPTGLTAFAKTDFSNTNLYKVLPNGTALNTVVVNGKYRITTSEDTPISGTFTWWLDVAEEGNGTVLHTTFATGSGAYKGMVRFTRRYVANQGWESWQVVGGRALIKSATGSQNWYNIYLELVGGTAKYWCEQGGTTEFVTGGTAATINYLIPIVNNYTTIITPTISGTLGTGLVYYKGTTTTSMTVQNNTNSSVIFEWYCVATCNKP